jgi:ribosome biogenesis GTPase A
LSGGRVDTARFAVLFLDELRGGKIGRISLEWPPQSVLSDTSDIKEPTDGIKTQNQ